MSQSFTPPTPNELRAEEARMLRERAIGSARSVFVLIGVIAISLASVELYKEAILWTCATSAMVVITILYARSGMRGEHTDRQVDQYLRGHVVISACTGILWAAGALKLASPTSELQTFLAGLFLTSITAGGVMAGTVYRPGYVALALAALTPFGVYLIVSMEGVQRIYGSFILLYLAFALTTNKAASQKTRDVIAARITSRKTAAALEEYQHAAKANRATKRSVEAIRHDMAQPMKALNNFLAELDRQATSQQQAILVQQIRLAVASQETLIQELSHVERSNVRPEFTEIDVPALLSQLENEYRPQFKAAHCEFAVISDTPSVTTNQASLERILRNFLSNAVKYGTSGGKVTLSVQTTEAESLWLVSDQGPGLTAEQLRDIRQGQSPLASAAGNGLGIGIAQQLAQDLGGTVAVNANIPQGATFSLHLPHLDLPQPQEQAFVLCIGNDQVPGIGAWSDVISSWVWKFAHVETGTEAAQLLEVLGQIPDLIVLDPINGKKPPKDELDLLKQVAPVVHFRRNASQPPCPMATVSTRLPEDETDLRNILESALQNNASSRAR